MTAENIARARGIRIEDELARRGIRLRGKNERSGPCPKCGGDDRFSINVTKQVFNCRGCETGGDVIDLVQHLDGCDVVAACTTLMGKSNGKGSDSAFERAIKKAARGAAKEVTAATFEYHAEDGAVAYAIDRIEFQNADGTYIFKDGKREKAFRQRRPNPDLPGAWLRNVDGVTKILYRLPELLEAVALGHLVFIVEGEGKVDVLREIGIVATTNSGGAGKWQPEFSEHLRGVDVVLLPDNDERGWKHITDVAASLVGVAARIRIVLLPDLPAKGDVVNWLAVGHTREELDALVETAKDWAPPSEEAPADEGKAKAEADEQKLIDELSRLDPLDYDRRRSEAADQIGIRRGTLDDQVNARRAQRAEEEGPPPLFGHWVVEPWPEAVDTGELIAALVARIKRHVVLSDEQAIAVALWILFAWVHDVAVHSPILLATSAEANSGKTTLISVIGFLVPRSLMTTGISEAALFRSIEKWQPTVIVDEADVLLIDNEPLRAVINSGWTRGSGVLRCVGENSDPHLFSTFCPKAVGMKGKKLPDTTLSRSIVIEMKRKRLDERAEHFRSIDDTGLAELRRRALRWASDNAEKLDGVEPVMPPGFDTRLGENWRLLLGVGDHAAGDWPNQARKAAIKLSSVAEGMSTGVQLLADIKATFDAMPDRERIGSAGLVAALGADAGSPWAEWKNGKPMTQTQLARVLKTYSIYPENIRMPSGSILKGYQRHRFEDHWDRYLLPDNGDFTRNTATKPVDKGEIDGF